MMHTAWRWQKLVGVPGLVAILVWCAAAQVPLDEKEAAKPPKVRSDLPLLPPLETLAKRPVSPLGEIMLEAERVQHPAIRDLLRRLSYPHDRLVLVGGKVLRIAPLARPLEAEKSPQIKVQVLDETGQVESQRTVQRDEVQRVEYYEVLAVQEVLQLSQEAGKLKPPLTRSQILQVANFILEQVRAFHVQATRQGIRAEGWQELAERLGKQERQIRMERLSALQEEQRLEEAAQWADQLLGWYPGDAEIVGQFRQLVETTAARAIERGDFAAVRRVLDRLRNRLPGTTSPAIERFQRALQDQADFHLQQARKRQEAGDMVSAWLAGAEAARLLPNWERVQIFQRQLLRQYPFLIVAVPDLPRNAWPGYATSLADEMAVALLYEWLLEPREPPLTSRGYWSSPGLVPFRSRGAWVMAPSLFPVLALTDSGEQAITWSDVRFSLEYTGQPSHLNYEPRWDKRWAKWRWWEDSAGRLVLERSFSPRDAMHLLHVPLVLNPRANASTGQPAHSRLSQLAIAGTGPYQLVERSETEWVFRVRPGWTRPHAPTGPILQEIRFRRYKDALQAHEDVECGAAHLVVGLTAAEADTFANLPHVRTVCLARQNVAPGGVAFTPRVAMLVFNRRRASVANAELRRALAAAIDREALVRSLFRGRDPTTYRVTHGIVPLASWAYHPDYSPIFRSPYRPALARELFQQLGLAAPPNKAFPQPGPGPSSVTQPLVIWAVAEEPHSDKVAQGIGEQLAAYGLRLDIRLISRQELLDAWMKPDPPYDALLWVAEYPHEGVVPFRWMAPAPPGQSWPDPFGLADEPTVAQLRQRYLDADDSAILRNSLHQLHAHLVEQAWVVPLWEMDSFIAVWQSLRVGQFHPLWVLHHVENWAWN